MSEFEGKMNSETLVNSYPLRLKQILQKTNKHLSLLNIKLLDYFKIKATNKKC